MTAAGVQPVAVTWFQVDSNSPNDPKIKEILRVGGQPWAGATWLMWCYIASSGKSEPGLGVRADGSPLPLKELASECRFATVEDLRAYLDFAAEQEHIHRQLWQDKGIVFLPAMWSRLMHYARSKGRQGSHYVDAQGLAAAVLRGDQKAPPVPTGPQKSRPVPAGPRRAGSALQTNKQTDIQTRTNTGVPENAAPAAHPVKEVLTYHDQLFQAKTGQPWPAYTDGDAKNVQLMLKKLAARDRTPEQAQQHLQAEIKAMFDSPDPFIQQCGYSIGAFQKIRGKLIVQATSQSARGDPGAKGRTPVQPGKYAGM